jgi:DNA-binding SARP family transcriptional activator
MKWGNGRNEIWVVEKPGRMKAGVVEKLKLSLFGEPQLLRDEILVNLPRRKTLGLLAYLAVNNIPYTRQNLAGVFWPEYDEEHARASLRNAIWSLKEHIGERWLVTNRDTFQLVCNQDFWVDVTHFRNLLHSCAYKLHPAGNACSACTDPLDEAIEIYHDDFMAGFNLPDCPKFDEWQMLESENLRLGLGVALERLVSCMSIQGDYDLAIQYAQRWLGLDSLNEEAHRSLMLAYTRSGQRTAALCQYQECVRCLQDELGISPSKETFTLYQEILNEQTPTYHSE